MLIDNASSEADAATKIATLEAKKKTIYVHIYIYIYIYVYSEERNIKDKEYKNIKK